MLLSLVTHMVMQREAWPIPIKGVERSLRGLVRCEGDTASLSTHDGSLKNC